MKRERLKAQVKEGKELMKKLVNSKQRLEGFTKAPIVQEMELDDQDQILQVAHTKVDNGSHPNVPRKEGNKKSKQQGGKGEGKGRGKADNAKSAAKLAARKEAENEAKEGNFRANDFIMASQSLRTRLTMLREELRNEKTAKKTSSPRKKLTEARSQRTPSPKAAGVGQPSGAGRLVNADTKTPGGAGRPADYETEAHAKARYRSTSSSPEILERMTRLRSPRRHGTPFPSAKIYHLPFGSANVVLENERGLGPRQAEPQSEALGRPTGEHWPSTALFSPRPRGSISRKDDRDPRRGEPGCNYKRDRAKERTNHPQAYGVLRARLKDLLTIPARAKELEETVQAAVGTARGDSEVRAAARETVKAGELAKNAAGRRSSSVKYPRASLVEGYETTYKKDGHNDEVEPGWRQPKPVVGEKLRASLVEPSLEPDASPKTSGADAKSPEDGGQRRSRESVVRFSLPDSPTSGSQEPGSPGAPAFHEDEETF